MDGRVVAGWHCGMALLLQASLSHTAHSQADTYTLPAISSGPGLLTKHWATFNGVLALSEEIELGGDVWRAIYNIIRSQTPQTVEDIVTTRGFAEQRASA